MKTWMKRFVVACAVLVPTAALAADVASDCGLCGTAFCPCGSHCHCSH